MTSRFTTRISVRSLALRGVERSYPPALLRKRLLSGAVVGGRYHEGAVSANKSLIDIITDRGKTTGLKLVLDAGDSVSYTSSQDWIDRSGNLGGDEFHRGTGTGSDSADPTFNGTAGGLSSAEYFSFDGGDGFVYGATNPAWVNTLHKDGAKFAILAAHYKPTGASFANLFNTGGNSNNNGIRFAYNWSANKLAIQVFKTTSTAVFSNNVGPVVPDDTWSIDALLIDEAAGGSASGFRSVGSSAVDFDGTYSSPGTGAAVGTASIGTAYESEIEDALSANCRIGAFAIWQGTVPSKSDLDNISDDLKGRFGL